MGNNQDNIRYIRSLFKSMLLNDVYSTDRLGGKTIEIIGASFLADEPAIFGEPNEEYIASEIDWYQSMSTNINDIYGDDEGRRVGKPPPKAWKYAADKHGNINSNYGHLIYSEKFYNQFENVICELESNPDSRRACMVYNRPSIWAEYDEGGKDDFICTNAVTYYLRENDDDWYLDCVVQMRSNDVIFGYRNDWAWQQHVLQLIADELILVTPGRMVWQVQNLHVYEKHFDLVRDDDK